MRRRGENVSAFELERTIGKHPAIAEVAVHGVSLPQEIDQSIKACLVLNRDAAFSLPEFAAFLSSELPYFAIPQFVEIVPGLPRNASGRVMKDLLREKGLTETTSDLIAMGLGIDKSARRAASTR